MSETGSYQVEFPKSARLSTIQDEIVVLTESRFAEDVKRDETGRRKFGLTQISIKIRDGLIAVE